MSTVSTSKANNVSSTAYTDDKRSDGIFGNPGLTLKVLGNVVFVIGVICSALGAFVIVVFTPFDSPATWLMYAEAAGVLIFGSFFSFVAGATLAAIGETARCARELNRKLH